MLLFPFDPEQMPTFLKTIHFNSYCHCYLRLKEKNEGPMLVYYPLRVKGMKLMEESSAFCAELNVNVQFWIDKM